MSDTQRNVERELVAVGNGHSVIVEATMDDSLFRPEPNTKFLPHAITEIIVAKEIGPCGGVQAATLGAEALAEQFADEQQVRVNARITNGADSNARLTAAGVVMDSDATVASEGTVYAVGAHGNERDYTTARRNGADVYDLTCIFVDKTHREVEEISKRVEKDDIPTGVVFLSLGGRADHAEFIGTRNRAEDLHVPFYPVFGEEDIERLFNDIDENSLYRNDWRRIKIISQTTNDSDVAEETADSIIARISGDSELADKVDTSTFIYNRDDVCRTVMLRQRATREVVAQHDIETLVVIGSGRSKNTKNLVKVALSEAKLRAAEGLGLSLGRIVMFNTHFDLPLDLSGRIGVVSGASVDSENVSWVLDSLDPANNRTHIGESDRDRIGKRVFPLPIRNRDRTRQQGLK